MQASFRGCKDRRRMWLGHASLTGRDDLLVDNYTTTLGKS
jgi:hypothetical protein